jgi:hypothetical protein
VRAKAVNADTGISFEKKRGLINAITRWVLNKANDAAISARARIPKRIRRERESPSDGMRSKINRNPADSIRASRR